MISISLSFPTGRYHATPWGRHVNEAAPEWPPSPWRLVRSLVAVWKRKCVELDPAAVESIFRELAALPQFLLPPASTGHTRHYMPWYKKGPDDRTLVFDAFVAVARQSRVLVLWPQAQLEEANRSVLGALLNNLGFLGRAEAWCEARLLIPSEVGRINPNCFPLNGQHVPPDHEIVPTLCADPDTAFEDDHVIDCEERSMGRGKNRHTETERKTLYDPNWNLCMETLRLHEKKWSDPPGSQWVSYVRPSNCFEVSPSRSRTKYSMQPRMQVARFALDSAVLPLVTETLSIAELARNALMGVYGRMNPQLDGSKGRSPTFSGKDAGGDKRKDLHLHAYYLPADEDGDGRLDHLTVIADEGFAAGELKAIDRLTSLASQQRGASGHPLRMLLLGLGRPEAFGVGPSAESQVWVSATPFLAPRHPKHNGQNRDDPRFWRTRTDEELEQMRKNSKHVRKHIFVDPTGWLKVVLREELARLLNRRPDLVDISVDNIEIRLLMEESVFRIGSRRFRPIQFKRYRQKRSDDGDSRYSGAFEIIFPRQIRGPVCLGHSSHFGLGLFLPKN